MYYRYGDSEKSKISEYTGFGMFAKNESRIESGYGSHRFAYDGREGISIYDLKDRFVDAWEMYKDCAPDYMHSLNGDAFFEAFNPPDIVDDAGAWDNDDFRQFFVNFIYDDELAIILDDGAIVFDENLICA